MIAFCIDCAKPIECHRKAPASRCRECRIVFVHAQSLARIVAKVDRREVEARIDPEAFWARVDRSGGLTACWLWTGTHDSFGYGVLRPAKQLGFRTHRIAWRLTNGPIADGAFICHRCDNPPCCNPAHLFVGDAKANHDDMVAKGRKRGHAQQAVCRRGHPLTPENTYARRTRVGRECRQCSAVRGARRRSGTPTGPLLVRVPLRRRSTSGVRPRGPAAEEEATTSVAAKCRARTRRKGPVA